MSILDPIKSETVQTGQNQGFMVNSRGLQVQGYEIDPTGVQGQQVGALQLGGRQSPPAVTQNMQMTLNLDAGSTPPAAFDPANPEATSNYSTSVTVYDSLGQSHRVDTYFRSNGGGAWEWFAMVDGGDVTGGTAGVPTQIANGTMTFTTSGALDTETVVAGSADFVGATPGQVINFDFGDAITTDGAVSD